MMKTTMLMLMITSPIIMMSMESWIMIWMLLEISSTSFISVMKSKYKNDGIMMYFLAQSIGSLMVVFSMAQSGMILPSILISNFMMTMGIMIKMGLIPFHQWFVMMCLEMELMYLFMMMTIQKMAPLILMSWSINNMNLSLFLVMGMIMSLFLQISQKYMKKLFIYSSIFQTSWMSMMLLSSQMVTMLYFMLYSIITLMIINDMEKSSMEMMTEEKMSMNFMINMSSMAGIPPLMGFIPKWMISKTLVMENMFMPLLMLMMITSVISIFIYMRFFFKTWMKWKNQFTMESLKSTVLIMQMILPLSVMMIV